MKIKEEFRKFMRSYGVLGVAIGIVMGQAVAKVITAIVEGLVMPILALFLPGDTWQAAVFSLGRVNFKPGLMIAAFIDFFAIAVVLFFLAKYIIKVEPKKSEKVVSRKTKSDTEVPDA